MQWFRDLIRSDSQASASEWLKVCAFLFSCVVSGACVHLVYAGTVKGDNAMYLLITLVIVYMSASGLVVVGEKFQASVGKLAEEKTKRSPAPEAPKAPVKTNTKGGS